MKKKILAILLTLTMLLSTASLLGTTVMAETADKVNTIANYEDLENFVKSLATYDYAGETVTVTSNITVNDGWTANDGQEAATTAPTGDNAKTLDTTVATQSFAGTFDGGNYTIKGLYINGQGLFSALNGATVKNITFANCYVNSTSNCAVLAGAVSGSTSLSGITVDGCKIYSTYNNTLGIGGIVTNVQNATLTAIGCKNVNGSFYSASNTSLVGGIVGGQLVKSTINLTSCENGSYLNATKANQGGCKVGGMISVSNGTSTVNLENCINTGDIYGSTMAAGMVADNRNSLTITNCVNTGKMTTGTATHSQNSYAAGMVGNNWDGSASVTINGCVNTGEISSSAAEGKSAYAGGIIGNANRAVSVTDAVNIGSVSSTNKAGGIVGNYSVKTGNFKRIISLGTPTGKDNYSAGAILGSWAQVNSTEYATFEDVYYADSASKYALGVYANYGTNSTGNVGKFKLKYTDSGKDVTFDGSTATSDWNIMTEYNNIFINNGGRKDVDKLTGTGVASVLMSFNFGENWILTDGAPIPAGVAAIAQKLSMDAEDCKVDYKGYQKKIGDDGKFNIRLIAGLDSTEFANTGFELYIVAKGEAALTYNGNTDTVYTSLNVYNGEGTLTDTVTAEGLECTYLSAIAVDGIPSTGTYTLVIKPYVTLTDGSGIEYGASYAMIIVDGAVVQHYAM